MILLLGNLILERTIKYTVSFLIIMWDFKYRKEQHYFHNFYTAIIPFFIFIYWKYNYKTLSDYFLSKNVNKTVHGILLSVDDDEDDN